MIYILDMEERIHRPLAEIFGKEFPVTPKMLDKIHTWSTDDRPVTLREYLRVRAQDAAEKLGLGVMEDETIRDVHDLNQEALRKITLAIYSEGDRNTALSKWGRSYLMDELIDQLQNNGPIAGDLIRKHKQSMSFQETIFKSGNVRFDPDDPSDELPELPEFRV